MQTLKLLLLGAIIGMVAGNAQAESKMVTMPSGLRYVDNLVGTGTEAAPGKVVSAHYTGWLLEAGDKKGKQFDSSVGRGQPIDFPLGAGMVIPGWEQGISGMKVGGKRTLYIPSKLGYGPRGAGNDIPPNADLIFDVELVGVK
jgi:peptidylprolyl isomerase